MREKESVCVPYACASAYQRSEEGLNPLELELQAIVSLLACVLGFKL